MCRLSILFLLYYLQKYHFFCQTLQKRTERQKKRLYSDVQDLQRERETFGLLIFHLSFLIFRLITTFILHQSPPLVNRKIKVLEEAEVCKKNDRLKGTVFRLFLVM